MQDNVFEIVDICLSTDQTKLLICHGRQGFIQEYPYHWVIINFILILKVERYSAYPPYAPLRSWDIAAALPAEYNYGLVSSYENVCHYSPSFLICCRNIMCWWTKRTPCSGIWYGWIKMEHAEGYLHHMKNTSTLISMEVWSNIWRITYFNFDYRVLGEDYERSVNVIGRESHA